jgi:hypothetical protein
MTQCLHFHRYLVTVRLRKPLTVVPYQAIVARDETEAIRLAKSMCFNSRLKCDGEWTARQEADPQPEREPADWM